MTSMHRHPRLDEDWTVFAAPREKCPVRVEVFMTREQADALVGEEMWRLDGLNGSPGDEAPAVNLGEAVASALRQVADCATR